MRIVWTENALACLQDIEDYIAQDSTLNATRFVERLIERTHPLAQQPNIGQPFVDVPHSSLRELTEGNYRIIYWIRRDQVEILSVFEGHYTREIGILKSHFGVAAKEEE